MNTEHLFTDIIDRDENLLWTGTPHFTAFMCGGLPFLAIGIIWGIIAFAFCAAPVVFIGIAEQDGHDFPLWLFLPFIVVSAVIGIFPFLGGILYMVWLYFSHRNTAYAFTNKRVMLRSGVFGIDYQIIDYDKIRDTQVNVGPIEKMFRVGSILFNTGEVSHKGHPMLKRFACIENPYDVFRQLKETTVNVKTDWNYPNAMRPDANPGYRTKYEPNEG